MDEHPLNIEVCNYDQWLTLVEERNHLRAKLAQAESERDAALAECGKLLDYCDAEQVERWAKLEDNLVALSDELELVTAERDAARQAAPFVYEVVDHTDDETYYTIGIWPTLESALEMVRQFADDPDGLERNGYIDDYCRVVVWQRPVGEISDSGTKVREFVWTTDYNEETDEYVWKMQEVKADD